MVALRRLTFLAVFGLCASSVSSCGGGGVGAQEACNEIYVSLCNKFYDCYTKDQIAANKDVFGLNRGDCAVKYQNSECTTTKVACDSGQTYHADKADACLSGFKALSCTDIMATTLPTPAVCDQVCQ